MPLPAFTSAVSALLPIGLRPLAKGANISGKLHEMHLSDLDSGETPRVTVVRGKSGGVYQGFHETTPGKSWEEIVSSLAKRDQKVIDKHFAVIAEKCFQAQMEKTNCSRREAKLHFMKLVGSELLAGWVPPAAPEASTEESPEASTEDSEDDSEAFESADEELEG
jgi:hypothetical protein